MFFKINFLNNKFVMSAIFNTLEEYNIVSFEFLCITFNYSFTCTMYRTKIKILI